MSSNDDSVSPMEAFGGWPGMDLGEEPATETTPAAEPEAPTEAESGIEPPVVGGDPNDTPDEPELPEWRQYGFKDEEAMWNSYKELQRTFHARNQPQPEEEDDDVEEEVEAPTWQSHQFQALGEIPRVGLSVEQRTQLADLMQVDPKSAALWALQNQEHMDPQDFKAVQNHWAQNDPYEYTEFRTALALHLQQQSRQAEEGPRAEYVLTQQREFAIQRAKEALPLMEERSEEFGDWLASPENRPISQMLDSIQDPERLRMALVSAFYQYAGPNLYQEMVTSHGRAAALEAERAALVESENAAREAASRGGRTQTRTAAAAPDGGGDADDALRALIANPYGS